MPLEFHQLLDIGLRYTTEFHGVLTHSPIIKLHVEDTSANVSIIVPLQPMKIMDFNRRRSTIFGTLPPLLPSASLTKDGNVINQM